MNKLMETKITVNEKIDIVNDCPEFCPVCDSGQTFYVDSDTYDCECTSCGHGWEGGRNSWWKE